MKTTYLEDSILPLFFFITEIKSILHQVRAEAEEIVAFLGIAIEHHRL